jgi:hypothetical protein
MFTLAGKIQNPEIFFANLDLEGDCNSFSKKNTKHKILKGQREILKEGIFHLLNP